MDVNASLEAPCAADALFEFVDDLAAYPQWIDLVHRAEPESPPVEGEMAWNVELRARLGPLARSKRLRMVRTVHDRTTHIAEFERRERDGKRHAPWVLHADVSETDGVSHLSMRLHYGGGLWTGGVLERALGEQIRNGRERLIALVGRR